jgi:quinol monooxygenase YgiN
MVHVLATIQLNPGVRDAYIEVLKSNIPNVLAEDGCVAYEAVIDFDSGLSAQGDLRDDVVVIVEKWESMADLEAHLAAPHMADYREKVKDMVVGVGLQILEPVK